MNSNTIVSLVRSYILTVGAGYLCLLLIFLLFNDIITPDFDGVAGYALISSLMIFLIPFPVAILYLLPISLFEEKRIAEQEISVLIKRYIPLPVIILSFIYSLFVLFSNEHYNSICFFSALLLQLYSVVIIQLCTYIRQLKS